MIEHPRKSTYGLCLLLVSLSLAMAQSLAQTNGALDHHPVSKHPSIPGLTEHPSVRAAGRGNPYVNLRDGHDLRTVYVGEAAPVQQLQQGQALPLSLAAADFDEDGVPDLVSGYSSSGGGLLALHRGNVDALFPNAPEAKANKAEGSFVDSPFFPSARVFEVSEPADFLEAGDFDADGHWDVVTAAPGSALLHLFSGNGRGDLRLTKSIQLPGAVKAMVAGEVNRRDGLTDLAVGVAGLKQPQVLVFESPLGALRGEPEVFSMPAEVTAMAMGQLDDEYPMDLAVAASSELVAIHGRDRKLSLDEAARSRVPPAVLTRHSFDATIISIAAGHFTDERQTEIAVLLNGGEVKLIGETRGTGKLVGKSTLLVPAEWSTASRLVRAKVSSLPHDDLVLIDPSKRQLHIFSGVEEKELLKRVVTSLDIEDEPIAVLPMRLNVDALDDLVILRNGRMDPTVTMTTPLSTFVVNSTADGNDCSVNDGVCSLGTINPETGQCVLTDECTLRAAIQQANASAGADAVIFSIGSGAQTISPAGSLPTISGALIIDGTTQPGFSGSPIIEINGASAVVGLNITAGSSVVQGLVINRAGGDGIVLQINGGNTIQGNYIGTNAAGTAGFGNSGDGVSISGVPNNTIGGTTAGARNLISGNSGYSFGVRIDQPTASGNRIAGNYIGVDAAGTNALGNTESGVLINFAVNNTIGGATLGERNIISGNYIGVQIAQSTSSGNRVVGNYIGTDAAGTVDLGNTLEGVLINSGSNNTIGGATLGEHNLISGNNRNGVVIQGSGSKVTGNFIGTDATGTADLGNAGVGVSIGSDAIIGGATSGERNLISGNDQGGVSICCTGSSQVTGNYIGADITGTKAIGNTFFGVRVGAPNNLIGGTTTGTRNIISGNGDGIEIFFTGATGNQLIGNYIGTTADGNSSLRNNGPGVSINFSASNNTIGGVSPDSWNKIQNNGGDGVRVTSGTGNRIVGNSIIGNSGLGINLGNNGVTPNDPGDADSGANNLQNFPVLTSVAGSSVSAKIEGSLNGTPNTTFTLDFYANDQCDPSLFGEGQQYIGSTAVRTDATGNINFIVFLQGGLNNTQVVTATATDASKNTSEFSACEPVVFVGEGEDPEVEVFRFRRVFVDYRPTILWQVNPLPFVASSSFSNALGLSQRRAFSNLPLAAVTNVKIELSRNGGATFETLFPSTPNDGSECWLVTGPTTTQALLRVSSTDNPLITGISPHPFEIVDSAGGGAITPVDVGPGYCAGLSAGDGRSQIRGNSFYADRYSFSGSKGQFVAVTLTSQSLDTYLYLLGPDGSIIAEDNNGAGGSDSRIPASGGFITLPANGTYVIEATSSVANALGSYQLKLESGPLLLGAGATERAVALDSVNMIREPFTLESALNFSADHRTRLSMFAANLELLAGEDSSVVTAQAEDSHQRVYPLTVEYVGSVPGLSWLTQINLRLPDELVNAGDVWVSTSLRGVAGNRVLVHIR